jgi:hypothetical protein
MTHPYHHSLSSVRKWGGKVGDYLAIRSWFDASKAFIADFRHRALWHHAEVIFMAQTIFSTSRSTAFRHVAPTGNPVMFC